jgi:hypothetical protein
MKTLGTLITSVFFLLTVSCSKELSKVNDDSAYKLDKGDFSVVVNDEIFDQAKQNRSAAFSDDFEIESVKRSNDTLQVTLVVIGDCDKDLFEVIWNGNIMESYPEQTVFLLKRNSENCKFIYIKKRLTLNIDLGEILKDKELAKRIVVTVSNASKKSSTPNADMTVSSN